MLWSYHFIFPPKMHEWYSFSVSSLAFGVTIIFHFSRSDKYWSDTYFGFNLPFSND